MRRPAPWRLLAVAGVLVLVGAVLALLQPYRCRVTAGALARVKEGMTRAQVEAILGPPGEYQAGPPRPHIIVVQDGMDGSWFGDEGTALVFFDGGVVISSKYETSGNVRGQ